MPFLVDEPETNWKPDVLVADWLEVDAPEWLALRCLSLESCRPRAPLVGESVLPEGEPFEAECAVDDVGNDDVAAAARAREACRAR